jgi:hypothetical protein
MGGYWDGRCDCGRAFAWKLKDFGSNRIQRHCSSRTSCRVKLQAQLRSGGQWSGLCTCPAPLDCDASYRWLVDDEITTASVPLYHLLLDIQRSERWQKSAIMSRGALCTRMHHNGPNRGWMVILPQPVRRCIIHFRTVPQAKAG